MRILFRRLVTPRIFLPFNEGIRPRLVVSTSGNSGIYFTTLLILKAFLLEQNATLRYVPQYDK